MIDDQTSLSTPFTAACTAADVVRGLDLIGREAILTGGHGRLGRKATRVFAKPVPR